MSYINVGARPAIHATGPNGLRPKQIKTKKALRELLSQDLTSVEFYGTSPFTPFRGTVQDIQSGTVLTVTGPDPYTARKWGASITIDAGGNIIMDGKKIKPAS